MIERIDDIDVQILELLQENGRMKRNQIAEQVGLSVPSVSERMRKLEARGVIDTYCAVLSAHRLQMDVTAFIRVTVGGSEYYDAFLKEAAADPEIIELHSITGSGSHLLKIRTKNTRTLERLLARVQTWPGVRSTASSIVLSTFKETRTLPVQPMDLPTETA